VEKAYVGNTNGNVASAMALSQTIGAILAAAPWARVDMVDQATWKAQVCGDGRMDKDGVAAWLRDFHPLLFAQCEYIEHRDIHRNVYLQINQDQVDAFCIGMYGAGRSGGAILEPTPKKKPKKRKLKSVA
jgi:Holliday junction resolvasome RuvABC endonuclease subunit